MDLMYQVADMVICRSGGSTIAELAIFGKYAILIPFPYAAENHQYTNAQYYETTGAATVLQNDECTVDKMQGLIADWRQNYENYVQKGNNGKVAAKPKAAEEVLHLIDDNV